MLAILNRAAALSLFSLSLVAGIGASQVGNRIVAAPSARAAAPMAAPFAFLTAETAAAFCLSIVALSEARDKKHIHENNA